MFKYVFSVCTVSEIRCGLLSMERRCVSNLTRVLMIQISNLSYACLDAEYRLTQAMMLPFKFFTLKPSWWILAANFPLRNPAVLQCRNIIEGLSQWHRCYKYRPSSWNPLQLSSLSCWICIYNKFDDLNQLFIRKLPLYRSTKPQEFFDHSCGTHICSWLLVKPCIKLCRASPHQYVTIVCPFKSFFCSRNSSWVSTLGRIVATLLSSGVLTSISTTLSAFFSINCCNSGAEMSSTWMYSNSQLYSEISNWSDNHNSNYVLELCHHRKSVKSKLISA